MIAGDSQRVRPATSDYDEKVHVLLGWGLLLVVVFTIRRCAFGPTIIILPCPLMIQDT